MAENYDLVVLGAGPGGYVAAARAAQLGMKVAVVEKERLGGVCLNKGCIPTKTLLRSAELYQNMKNSEEFGIAVGDVNLEFDRVQKRKQKVVDTLHKGVEGLLKKNKVDVYYGTGRILGPSIFSPMPGTISVEHADSSEEPTMLVPKNVLIATGSRPRTLPGLEVDGQFVMNSDHALQMEELPKSMIIIGGGVIGVEWASMLSDFGVDVTIVEYMDRILPLEDEDVSKEMARLLKKRKVKILTGAKVLPETVTAQGGKVTMQVEKGGEVTTLEADRTLVSVGREANIDDIGLQNTSIKVEKGVIQVNEFMQTEESHIYAIGDVIGGYQLAHVASHEGILAVEHMAGKEVYPIDPLTIPRCTYSRPEVGSIGLTEAQAKEKGYEVKVGKFPFRAVGKSLVFGEMDGFIKIISDKKTDDLLGVHIIGPHATDMISEAGLAKVLDATAWEIAHTIHPHPTLSEVYAEAAMAVDGKPIHG
ncbi:MULTISPECIES: dihydrolipoyl dehydrogenase [Thermoactinomyces]|jgi:dihydrolipoamide dehydrogenase|uniref:dihydrolipoyl dehydrogenase n=1 Tax=Thermoactinomyces TaxID=2023 RepID=UPI0011078768|nr:MULTISPECIES: dihydrolipoyl dehydrogenase [Thermoactinomyces]MBH8584980.1 dihydrolipoyl dehydrogenase [Thermoactinomyces sp. CICC 10520]MBI0386204.1 dihydrolipoyl dehydrogenase [Thermoactinomyces sp. CICC 24227]MBI0390988.1 dihydrolipoyl dehydrogenase [Thermoactinomyces sp. CICC 24226]MCF6134250.1 dihydrolipoyl dehydrogenase [Thermoactinomyces vulgaris]QCV55711.1 dihydrolipoyl dehydrogenase [Thermoactinomyces vulgaris]